MAQEVRICVCGDEGTGKSSLIASLVKDVFITNKIQAVLPPITIPPNIGTPENVTTTIVDTSARPQDRTTLRKEIRKCNVILLVYADHYSYERVALFWMPYFRSLGVNVPVVLCANKSDLASGTAAAAAAATGATATGAAPASVTTPAGAAGAVNGHSSPGADGKLTPVLEEEMVPVMQEFREIDSCIRASAREHHNVNEVFFLCQKAVTHPIAPLFDYKEGDLKPACVAALRRIFYLCDKDQDGYLNDRELHAFQETAFSKPLAPEDLASIKLTLAKARVAAAGAGAKAAAGASVAVAGNRAAAAGGVDAATTIDLVEDRGVDLADFLQLNRIYAEKGRHETIWVILRKFHYTDSLSLADSFLHPRFDVPEHASAELSPAGYRFFMDLFLLFDKDNDGGLNDAELSALFAPTPGVPPSWVETDFPASTVRNEAGHITLQGWLAQWSMTTFLEPTTTLEYLAYLGFETPGAHGAAAGGPTAALKITKPRKRRRRPGRVDRNVVLCYLVGAPGAGKSTLLDAFLGRPFDPLHRPTIRPRRAVNSVELAGGKQCYLILEELGELEPAVLENPARLDACDLLCFAYDSSDPDSFGHLVELRRRNGRLLDEVPAVYAALKADRDKTTQRSEQQPDAYTTALRMSAPLHVSATWESISELFVSLAETATTPSLGFPKSEEPAADRTSLYVALGAVACAAAAAFIIVLPPPPRYPTQMLYNGAYMGGQIVPMIETNNLLTNPTGPDCPVPCLYVLEEDLLLATPPPHPSEAPVVNPNPLATTPLPASAGTKITLLTIIDPPQPRALSLLLAGAASSSSRPPTAAAGGGAAAAAESAPFAPVEEHPNESESGGSTTGAGATAATGLGSGSAVAADSATGRLSFHTTSAVSGASDTALVSSGTAPGGSDVPATSGNPGAPTTTNNSSNNNNTNNTATTAASALAGLAGMGSSKAAGGKQRKPKNNVTKSNSSFISRVIVNDTLTKRLQERSPSGLFAFANINRAFQWLDMASEKKVDYLTKILFTKAHCLCHDINPLTKSAAHIDVIMGFSTGEIIWWEPISQRYTRLNKNGVIRGTPVSDIRWMPGSENLFMAAFMDGSLVVFDKEREDAPFVFDEDEINRLRLSGSRAARTHIHVERSIYANKGGTQLKTNPFAFWKLSNQRINAFAFAPKQSLVAVVSEDGSLRIIDYLTEELLGLYYSYYGGLTCVCWSPDGKYVVTGGQDDLLSIWCVADATLVARCQGHHSWVTAVAFDPWRCDERNYRIGSVGEDSRLCLWDFSVGMLIRPKAAAATTTTTTTTATTNNNDTAAAAATTENGTDAANGDGDERVHPVEPRARTASLPPVSSQIVDVDPLCWLQFTERSIMTSSKTGHIRTWKRPTDNAAPTNGK
ncbi:miro-2-like, mitochondrial GTPase [Niveomyces insectorum RCEF 264]|uniref:Mitochondrial Rho GTPase 1 n=1 Tax=Niveomyces insectorum RCEF 264 TaxID=1081102 RepID=A0A167TY44_9HYPO|nr:miro-2-like, mitochondrial GTPase [Niveomyces insectorum RCEF 264]